MSLTATRSSDQLRVLARDAEKSDGPYICVGCGEMLTLKKGRVVVHHFAHKPPVRCSWGTGESAQHHAAKLAIFDALRADPNVADVALEAVLEGGISVADVLATIRGQRVAIEVQRSKLTAAMVARRTSNYHMLGVHVLWVGLPGATLSTSKYSPSQWEKWVHFANFGRVYYWSEGQVLMPYHFGDFSLYVPESTWYAEGGSLQTAGGYAKRSRRWRTPQRGTPVLIGSHFRGRRCEARTSRSLEVPQCSLYLDQQAAWWMPREGS